MAKKKNPVEETKKYWVHGIVLLILAAYIGVSLFGLEVGTVGAIGAKALRYLFGYGAFYLPLFLFGGAIYLFYYQQPFWNQGKFYGWLGVAFFSMLLFHQGFVPANAEIMPESLPNHGGLFAGLIVFAMRKNFGNAGMWILAASGFSICLLYCTWGMIFSYGKKYQEVKAIRKADEKVRADMAPEPVKTFSDGTKRSIFDYHQAKFPFDEEEEAQEEKKSFLFDEPEIGKDDKNIPLFQGTWRRQSEGPVPWEDGYDQYQEEDRKKWEAEKQQIRGMDIQPETESEWEFDRPVGGVPSVRRKESPYHETPTVPAVAPEEVVSEEVIGDPELDQLIEAAYAANREDTSGIKRPKKVKPYRLPPLSLLNGSGKKTGASKNEIRDKAILLERTLSEFGVKAQVVNYTQGPAVTRFELELAPGVKVNKILNLTDDLALKLATSGLRIEAPIPGKAAVGIEVPNQTITSVALKDVLDTPEFKDQKSKLCVGLGKDIAGTPIVANLAQMPHMLVAGATGSGKSVCINTIIASILFRALPTEVKFIMVDPKMVELTAYNDIPHLLTPVVNDPKQAATALRWAVREMERRYALLAAATVRDLARYNELAEIHNQEKLPEIVVIIDELADLMMVSPVDVQEAICRLAQKARASGIHLILATQRPSVDVITGLIKANIPSRISFAVSSQIDSRTILDMGGAEKLLGKGDMLFAPAGMAKPLRVQGAFVSDDEIVKLLDFIKNQSEEEPEYLEEITVDTSSGSEGEAKNLDDRDELWEDALRIIMETGQASTSMLQRRFRIGFSRAGRLIDQMEVMGIIGPPQGSKPRELMMSPDQIYQRFLT